MPGILVFVPMYNCERQIGRVVQKLAPLQKYFAEILFVDNHSTDGTLAAARAAAAALKETAVTLIRNDENYDFGGSNKVAFTYAREKGFDHLVILHGDDQADITDIIPILARNAHNENDLVLGARFQPGSKLSGYSKFRAYGNIALDWFATLLTGTKIYDTGAGLGIYGKSVLDDPACLSFPDDLTFSAYPLLDGVRKRRRIAFFPISWHRDEQTSNARVMRQGFKIGISLLRHFFHLGIPVVPSRAYSYRIIYQAKAVGT